MKTDLKRTAAERKKLLVLLSKEALTAIMEASVYVCTYSRSFPDGLTYTCPLCVYRKANSMPMGVVEGQYMFLKRVCQVLVHLGTSQLALLWVGPSSQCQLYSPWVDGRRVELSSLCCQNSASFQRPESFELYLEVVLEFTKHSSQVGRPVERWNTGDYAITIHAHVHMHAYTHTHTHTRTCSCCAIHPLKCGNNFSLTTTSKTTQFSRPSCRKC